MQPCHRVKLTGRPQLAMLQIVAILAHDQLRATLGWRLACLLHKGALWQPLGAGEPSCPVQQPAQALDLAAKESLLSAAPSFGHYCCPERVGCKAVTLPVPHSALRKSRCGSHWHLDYFAGGFLVAWKNWLIFLEPAACFCSLAAAAAALLSSAFLRAASFGSTT